LVFFTFPGAARSPRTRLPQPTLGPRLRRSAFRTWKADAPSALGAHDMEG
jgi:hypothetical protein